jgi:hypothetical protein
MIKKEIEIVVETGAANKDVNQLKDTIEDTGGVAKKSGAEATKSIEGVGKASKDTEKSAKGASVGVKAIGLALKALGIGLILAAVGFLADAFSRNQRFADLLSVALTTISNVTSDLVTAIFNTVEQVMKATNGFESLGKVVKGLVTIAFTPLKLSLLAIKLAFQETQLAWEKSFFGDNDAKTITELNDRIDKTRLNILEVGKDAIKAGKDVATNIVGAIVEVANVAIIANNNLSKVSITSALEQAKVTTQLKNSAEIAAASIQGLIEKYDREAELLRQIRDDDRLSIAERIKANEELGLKLDEQAEAQKNLANVGLQLARQNLKGNEDNVALRKAEIDALNEIAAIEASVTGFRAEQLTNRNALDKERIELLRSLNEIGKTDLELAKSEAEQLRDDRLIQIELQVEDENEKFRLLAAARADFDKTISDLDAAEDQRVKDAEAKAKADADTNAKAKIEIAQKEADAKRASVDGYVGQVQQAAQILGQETAAGKALAAAGALFSTYESATKSYNALAGIPVVGPALGVAAAGLAVTNGLKNVKQILSVKVAGQSGGGSVGGAAEGGGRQSSPAFNLTGRSNVNQLQTGIDQQETAPVRAFVVSQDVTSQQAADRATRSQASFG